MIPFWARNRFEMQPLKKKKKNKGVFVVTRFTTREGNEHRQVKTSEALWARTGNVGGIAFFSPKE